MKERRRKGEATHVPRQVSDDQTRTLRESSVLSRRLELVDDLLEHARERPLFVRMGVQSRDSRLS
jgi:hypothetical protein